MPFESRVFELPKDPEHPEEHQDAYGLDAARGIAAVADGVASSLFARQWAGILAEATVAGAPDPDDKDAFSRWLGLRRQAWSEQIDVNSLAWFQRAKLPLGAFSTLLWVEVSALEEDRPGAFGAYRLRGFAIGDSCLFHVRHGEVLRTFPVQKAAELEADPLVLGSVDLKRDRLLKFVTLDELCYPDDLLVLCTDAIAAWALRLGESGNPPAWNDYWNVSRQDWQEEIVRLRNEGQMRYDDATLVLLRVTGTADGVRRPGEGPATPEAVRPRPQTVPGDQGSAAPEENWKEEFRAVGKQAAGGIDLASDRALRGWKKWKQKAIRKYRETFGKRDE